MRPPDMARILITGSSDGLGSAVAKRLVARGHYVVIHGRNAERAKDALSACPDAEAVLTGDLSSIAETKSLAKVVNGLGAFDCIIHNAGLYRGSFQKTKEGVPALVAVNTLAPYILTNLIKRPKRLVFLSSEMHHGGSGKLEDVLWQQRGEKSWNESSAYSDSKLHNIMFAKAFARRWPNVKSNALDPGWVATKMGGPGATGSMDAAIDSYVMLAEGTEEPATTSGGYFRPGKREGSPAKVSEDTEAQERLLEICAEFTRVKLA